jgi:uncharacterized protein
MDWVVFLVPLGLGAVVTVTSFISGVFGMAGGIILLAILLGSGMPVAAAMAFHGIAQASGNIWRAWLWRRHVDLRILAWFAAGALMAFTAFSIVRIVPDRATVLILLGLVPFFTLTLPERIVPQADRTSGALAAGTSTVGITLLAGVAGPLLDAFFVRTKRDRRDVVATKAGCSFLGNTMKTIYFSMVSAASWSFDMTLGSVAILASVIGTTASRRVLEGMTDIHFRRWTQTIILVIGSISITMGVMDLLQR